VLEFLPADAATDTPVTTTTNGLQRHFERPRGGAVRRVGEVLRRRRRAELE
jgi:hypothetical protein